MRNYNIYDAIRQEREYQVNKWGNEADDTLNTPNDWVSYIARFATGRLPEGFTPYDTKTVDEFRTSMIKVATLAVAAVESIDRQRDEAGHTFYEVETLEPLAANLNVA